MEHNDQIDLGCYPRLYEWVGISPHSLCGYFWMFSQAICRDTWEYVRDKAYGEPNAKLYMLSGWNAFWTRRVYTFVEDSFNRPIFGAPGAWIDVIERKFDRATNRLVPATLLRRCLNLGSYNYLGFGGFHPVITPQLFEVLNAYGPSINGLPLVHGITAEQRRAETMIANFLGKEDAIIVPMGFATNSTILPCLVGPGCLVVSDSLNHASIITGVKLSGAKAAVFNHNDMGHLETILSEAVTKEPGWKKILIIVEGIYSMEGEMTNLPDILALKKKYGVYLYVDEAHSIGGVGPSGRGVCDYFGIDTSDVDILMGTFTKSFASVGGYIVGSRQLVAHLRQTCFASVYGSGISPVCARQISAVLELMQQEEGMTRLKQLRENSIILHQGLKAMGCTLIGPEGVPVIPVYLYHPNKIADFSRECFKQHVAVVSVGYPATSVMDSRVRFCVSAAHTPLDMEYALKVLKEVVDKCAVDYTATYKYAEHHKSTKKFTPKATKTKAPTYIHEPLCPAELIAPTPCRILYPEAAPQIILSSFDFLGLGKRPETIAACTETISEVGCGSCGPRGFYGTTRFHLELEKRLAAFYGTEAAVAYSYGGATMTSVLPALAQAGDYVVWDDGCGFGVRSGLRLSRATIVPFAHNDIQNLEEVLTQLEEKPDFPNARARFLVVEGLYYGTGDRAPLHDLIRLKQRHRLTIILDDSLSVGVYGNGKGAAHESGVPISIGGPGVDYVVGSLETSLCSMGGFCVCTHASAAYQSLNSTSYCFSASCPPFLCAAACSALTIVEHEGADLSAAVRKNAATFRRLLSEKCPAFTTSGDAQSPVIPLRISQQHPIPSSSSSTAATVTDRGVIRSTLLRVSEFAANAGVVFGTPAEVSPFIDENTPPALVACVSASHTEDQLVHAVEVLAAACERAL